MQVKISKVYSSYQPTGNYSGRQSYDKQVVQPKLIEILKSKDSSWSKTTIDNFVEISSRPKKDKVRAVKVPIEME